MPNGLNGQTCLADVVSNTVVIARIATGDAEGSKLKHPAKRASGLAEAKALKENTSPDRHKEIEPQATKAKWN